MKKYFGVFVSTAICLTAAFGLLASGGAPRQPVFVYLQADVTDHINSDITEDRLRHLLPMLAKLRDSHPDAHVSATLMISGATADALSARNTETHIVDFIKEYEQKGIIEIGYDGADEPTYATRPLLNFKDAKTVADRWHVREAAIEQLIAEGRDPVTGNPMPGKSGGLKRVQEVFGTVAYVTGLSPAATAMANPPSHAGLGLTSIKDSPTASATPEPPKPPVPTVFPEIGADSEIVYEVRRYNDTVVMAGLPEDNPAKLPGFGGAEEGFMRLVSPAVGNSPEVYWQDNVLRLSEVSDTSEEAEEAQHDYEGLTAKGIQGDLGELTRSRVQVVRVELADERYYLQHSLTKDDDYALKYAYAHPNHPTLPAEARISSEAVNAAYTKEADALQWIAGQFFDANSGSRFLSNADLKQMAVPSTGFSVSMSTLRNSMVQLRDKWGTNTYPPAFVEVGDRYLSLADTFQVLTDALAEFDRSGELPDSVRVVPVWGPEHTPTGHGPNAGEVTVADVTHAASALAARLHDTSAGDIPKNSIPVAVTVGGTPISSSQFLRLMMEALIAPSPDTKLRIRMTYMHPEQAALMPKTRIMTEMGAMWTVKPAQLQIGGQTAQVQK